MTATARDHGPLTATLGRPPSPPFDSSGGSGSRAVLRHSLHTLAVILAAVFVAEIAIMLVLPLFPEMTPLQAAILNAVLQVVILCPILYVLVFRPIRARAARWDVAVSLLAESEQRFRDVSENANEWIWEVDATGRYTYSSGAIARILGYTAEEVRRMHFYDLFHPVDRDALKKAAFEVFASKQSFQDFLNRNRHKNGDSVWLSTSGVPILGSDGQLLGYRGTDSVKLDQASLKDELTQVVNRTGFYILAEQQMRIARREERQIALLFADIDGLKEINDNHGHAGGDRAIVDVAALLRESVRGSDIVSRFGGDEFVVLLAGATTHDVEAVVMDKIQMKLDTFNRTAGRPYSLSFSVGVARLDPSRPVTLDELIVEADATMYRQKRRRGQDRDHSEE